VSDATISKETWAAYYLTNRDYRGLSYEAAAEEMGITTREVATLLLGLREQHPDLFVDISGDGRRPDHNTKRYSGWCDEQIKQTF
jgi:hypothetical protein